MAVAVVMVAMAGPVLTIVPTRWTVATTVADATTIVAAIETTIAVVRRPAAVSAVLALNTIFTVAAVCQCSTATVAMWLMTGAAIA